MELKLLNADGAAEGASTAGTQSTVAAPDTVFGRDYNEALIHQLVTAYQANARSGNRAQKGRSEIAKSTRKPWRQKGTGRARAGMASSPLWRGGGRIFPNLPDENFTHKINKKMYRAGVCSILSQLAREGRLSVVDSFTVDAPKTKLLADKLKGFGSGLTGASTLVIADAVDENLMLASRNLQGVLIVEPRYADPVSLVQYKNVILTRSALAKIEEMLS